MWSGNIADFEVGMEYTIQHTKKTSQFDRPDRTGTIRVRRPYRIIELHPDPDGFGGDYIIADSLERKKDEFINDVDIEQTEIGPAVPRRINADQIEDMEPLERVKFSSLIQHRRW